ncbi:hypothetical protein PVAP13_4KG118400 [Panicum virgatum]|uniref:Uncharacterized protein n=1 Tax=Panicum virgatum TaxID=38727 RepID=A0A8T0TLE3_PANVG|nr:hypothetical protein PVAP13_4KG118400 [Panicum virgatum]
MSHYAESGRGGRARSRLQGRLESARSDRIAADHADPVGELSGFPQIPCPECGQARVIEGRTKKYLKLCGFYTFEKAYFQKLKDVGIIMVRPATPNWEDENVEEEESSVHCPNGEKNRIELEQKMESLIRKMDMFFVCVVCVLVGSVFMYAVMK